MKHPRRVATTAAIGGCYAKPGFPGLSPPAGTLRAIDSPRQNCTANETALAWNQTGPQGPLREATPMGLTRKLLSMSTVGMVDFRSDKERIARSTRRGAKQVAKQTRIMRRDSQG